jgi:OPA family glycerol-3-phosphate transporter-like MFS transporter
MLLTTLCVVIYWLNPPGNPKLDIAMLIGIGFLIYGPIMLIGVFALDLVPKKASGTAVGFIGFFGYVGGAAAADILIPAATDFFDNWDAGFLVIISACVMAIVLATFTIKAEMRSITAV